MTAQTKPVLFGDCNTARGVESGVIASRTPAADWHRTCPGILVGARGESRCACECHVGQEISPIDVHRWCGWCGNSTTDREKQYTTDGLRCVDTDACDTEYARKIATNPAFARMIERREQRLERRNQLILAESAAGATLPGRAKSGRCQFTGEPTRGGKFLPGNDAKLKKVLQELADRGDRYALAEILYRGWPYREETVSPVVASEATAFLQNAPADDWFDERIARRWRRIENGTAPERAVREEETA